ncbi:MAG TPA: DUF2520 domain-containing protein [Acidimicrobiia bacterium]|jgi:predicted short-subunit dehydrogenase-like oxidoreductase (DUF2520 family)
MDITLVGPGRAGLSVARAASAAGHGVVGVVARRDEAAAEAAEYLRTEAVSLGADLPPCDLVVIAVRDDAIAVVAEALASSVARCRSAVHLSGLAGVDRLAPLASAGLAVGAFHPLQTLPTPDAGSARLAGAWIGVTTEDAELRDRLHELATTIGALPFDVADDAKAVYHAAAAAAANYPLASLVMASDLFEAAGVPWETARPMVEAVVDNAFSIGPRSALTGPVARGDVATVAAQLDAVHRHAPEWLASFASAVSELARITGRGEAFADLLADWRPPASER